MSHRPSFRSIPAPLDVDDQLLDRINTELGVPTLQKPTPESASASHGKTQDAPSETPRPSPARAAPNVPKAENPAPKPSSVERIGVDLPAYLTKALRREAFTRETSVRHLIMLGLAAIGLDIPPHDLVPDRRKVR
jgi:hypothetical protein